MSNKEGVGGCQQSCKVYSTHPYTKKSKSELGEMYK